MKCSFLLVAGLSSVITGAQEVPDNRLDKLKQQIVTVPEKQRQGTLLTDNNYLLTLPNGNKLHILPQDNMPCIAPSMQQFNMPNAGTLKMLPRGRNAIPDPSRPAILLASSASGKPVVPNENNPPGRSLKLQQ